MVKGVYYIYIYTYMVKGVHYIYIYIYTYMVKEVHYIYIYMVKGVHYIYVYTYMVKGFTIYIYTYMVKGVHCLTTVTTTCVSVLQVTPFTANHNCIPRRNNG